MNVVQRWNLRLVFSFFRQFALPAKPHGFREPGLHSTQLCEEVEVLHANNDGSFISHLRCASQQWGTHRTKEIPLPSVENWYNSFMEDVLIIRHVDLNRNVGNCADCRGIINLAISGVFATRLCVQCLNYKTLVSMEDDTQENWGSTNLLQWQYHILAHIRGRNRWCVVVLLEWCVLAVLRKSGYICLEHEGTSMNSFLSRFCSYHGCICSIALRLSNILSLALLPVNCVAHIRGNAVNFLLLSQSLMDSVQERMACWNVFGCIGGLDACLYALSLGSKMSMISKDIAGKVGDIRMSKVLHFSKQTKGQGIRSCYRHA